MAGKRRPITLRKKRGAYVADIYRQDGRRTTVSFGAARGRTVSEIHVAFSKWVDLFKEHPSKVLSFNSPYDALDSMIHPGSIQTVAQLVDNYVKWAGQYLAPLRALINTATRTVLPFTNPSFANDRRIHEKTLLCVSTLVRRRVRETLEWSGVASSSQ